MLAIKDIMKETKQIEPFIKFNISSRLRNCFFFHKKNVDVVFNILEVFEIIIKLMGNANELSRKRYLLILIEIIDFRDQKLVL